MLAAKYRNFDKKQWAKFFVVKVPDFDKKEIDLPGSMLRLQCRFCNFSFTGTKTRAVSHLIGDPTNAVAKCALASAEAQLWARSDRAASSRKKNAHVVLHQEAERQVQNTSQTETKLSDPVENQLQEPILKSSDDISSDLDDSHKRKFCDRDSISDCSSSSQSSRPASVFAKSHVQKGISFYAVSQQQERAKKKEINDTLLVQAIVHSGTTAFRFVQNPFFKAFCHGISEGRYTPPDRKS
jgi:hypothetical protein